MKYENCNTEYWSNSSWKTDNFDFSDVSGNTTTLITVLIT